jgi:hypothetical protein
VATGAIYIVIEATPKRAFARAIDWPGWARSGETAALALGADGRDADALARLVGELRAATRSD